MHSWELLEIENERDDAQKNNLNIYIRWSEMNRFNMSYKVYKTSIKFDIKRIDNNFNWIEIMYLWNAFLRINFISQNKQKKSYSIQN